MLFLIFDANLMGFINTLGKIIFINSLKR